MDREKLNKAAEDHAKIMGDVPAVNSTHAFKAGADWLMQQPLSERLTDEEKEKIRDIMKHPQRHTELIKGTLNFQAIGIKKVLTEIFGADLFKEI